MPPSPNLPPALQGIHPALIQPTVPYPSPLINYSRTTFCNRPPNAKRLVAIGKGTEGRDRKASFAPHCRPKETQILPGELSKVDEIRRDKDGTSAQRGSFVEDGQSPLGDEQG